MKTKFYLPFFLVLSCAFLGSRVHSQCPATALISSGNTCISLQWAPQDVPAIIPASVEFDGSVYTYSNGLGVTGFPAVFSKPPGECVVPINVFAGSLLIHFSTGDITCQFGVILALHDLSFDAAVNQKQNLLKWSIKEDNNSNVYEIQRSIDGANFSTIKSIAAKGNTTDLVSYSFTDEQPSNTAYYRLKVVEKTGSPWFSKIVKLRNDFISPSLSVYPNPNKGAFVISGITSNDIKTLAIYDVQGRKIPFRTTSINEANQTASISVKGAGTGVLFVQYFAGNTRMHTRFLVQ